MPICSIAVFYGFGGRLGLARLGFGCGSAVLLGGRQFSPPVRGLEIQPNLRSRVKRNCDIDVASFHSYLCPGYIFCRRHKGSSRRVIKYVMFFLPPMEALLSARASPPRDGDPLTVRPCR